MLETKPLDAKPETKPLEAKSDVMALIKFKCSASGCDLETEELDQAIAIKLLGI